jgi:DNA polymerase III alpha subunit (gram-positive type)
MKYLGLDVETGGVDLDKSLLTSYLGVYIFNDGVFTLEDELYLYTKPNDGVYHCNGEAMGINKIDLVEHDKKAITYGEAGGILREFLIKNSNNGKDKLIPIGHNVKFDTTFIKDKILKTFEHYVSYRTLDTGPIAQFLKLCGLIPDDKMGGLSKLAEHVGCKPEGELHDAKTDTHLTVAVLQKFIALIKKPQ